MKTIIWFRGTHGAANSRMIAGLSRAVKRRGWSLSVLPRPSAGESMREIMAFWDPDGVITALPFDAADYGRAAVVIMSERPKGFTGNVSFITHDNAATAEVVAKELLSLGYPHHAFVGARTDGEPWSDAREREFRRILALHGLDCTTFRPSAEDRANGLAFQRRLRRFLSDLPKPCALFAAHDPIGAEVLAAAHASGIAVPGELAVCSVDDDEEICLNTVPTLTSVHPEFERAGMLACLRLAEVFADKSRRAPPTDYRIGPGPLVRRTSTRREALTDARVYKALEFISRETPRGLAAAEVAALFPCSPRMAQIRFKKATGQTIQEAILETRTELAKSLLQNDRLALDALANLAGWSSARLLRLHFLKKFGLTPGEWRRRHAHPKP